MAFPETNRSLLQRRDVDCEMSGSTCCVCLLLKGKRIVVRARELLRPLRCASLRFAARPVAAR